MIGSIAPNGSSISISDGFAASARARPTRCRWPPDSSAGYRFASSALSPTSSSSSAVRTAIRFFGQPSRRGTVPMFAPMVMCGKSPTCWIT